MLIVNFREVITTDDFGKFRSVKDRPVVYININQPANSNLPSMDIGMMNFNESNSVSLDDAERIFHEIENFVKSCPKLHFLNSRFSSKSATGELDAFMRFTILDHNNAIECLRRQIDKIVDDFNSANLSVNTIS